jgi:predicted dehydrogenase
MKKIRIGVIGTGQIGQAHIEKYSKIPGAEVVAVCNTTEEKARHVAELHSIPEVYTDYRKLLERDDLDAVDVCLHNTLHASVSIAAMRAGKHVYCEKPIAGTYRDGKMMLQTAKETGRRLHIQLYTLFQKETKAAKTLIDDGLLGRIYHARSAGFRRRYRPFVDGAGAPAFTRKETANGGALLDMGVYHIAQLLYLLNMPKVERIRGKLYQEVEMDTARKEESGFDVEEFAAGFVSFEQGLTMDIMESWAVHMGGFEGSSLMGSKGGIRIPDSNPHEKFSYHTKISDIDMDCTTDLDLLVQRWKITGNTGDAYDSSQHHWIAVLQDRVELLPTADLALQTSLISEGIYLSNALGREVSVTEVDAL